MSGPIISALTEKVTNAYSFGFVITGRACSEQTLIRIAYAFEQLTLVRGQRKPYITPAHDLGDIVQATHLRGGNNEAAAQAPLQKNFH